LIPFYFIETFLDSLQQYGALPYKTGSPFDVLIFLACCFRIPACLCICLYAFANNSTANWACAVTALLMMSESRKQPPLCLCRLYAFASYVEVFLFQFNADEFPA